MDIARHVIGCHLTKQTRVRNIQGLADITRRVIECHFTHQTRFRNDKGLAEIARRVGCHVPQETRVQIACRCRGAHNRCLLGSTAGDSGTLPGGLMKPPTDSISIDS